MRWAGKRQQTRRNRECDPGRGEDAGMFAKGIDPIQLYVSMFSLSYLYVSNYHTFSAIFGFLCRRES
jgi:hypothetical protein